MANTVEGNLRVLGDFTCQTMTVPPAVVTDASVKSDAGISPSKLGHYYQPTGAQPNTAAADETRVLYVARAAGTVLAFSAGSIAKAVGDAVCTVDLKKNGSSILSAVITLDSANTDRGAEAGTLTGSATVVAGDVLEVVVDGTIGTGTLPTGVFWSARIQEAA